VCTAGTLDVVNTVVAAQINVITFALNELRKFWWCTLTHLRTR